MNINNRNENKIDFSKITADLANEIIQEQGDPSKALIPLAARKKKIQLEIESSLQQFSERVAKGTKALISNLELLVHSQPDQFNKAIEELMRMTTEAVNADDINQQLQDGKSYKEIYLISDTTIEACYQAAIEFYNHQEYENASNVFYVLSLLDPQNASMWLGLGNSEYFRKRYEEALMAYGMSAFADPSDPQCHFYAAHCYENLGQLDLAINSLEIALFVIRSNPSLQEWEKQAIDYLNFLTTNKVNASERVA